MVSLSVMSSATPHREAVLGWEQIKPGPANQARIFHVREKHIFTIFSDKEQGMCVTKT